GQRLAHACGRRLAAGHRRRRAGGGGVTRSFEIPGGAADSLRLRRRRALTLTCLGDGANVSMLIYSAENPLDRLNIPDTLKAQRAARWPASPAPASTGMTRSPATASTRMSSSGTALPPTPRTATTGGAAPAP